MYKHKKEQFIDFWSNNSYNIPYILPLHTPTLSTPTLSTPTLSTPTLSWGSLQLIYFKQMAQAGSLDCTTRLLKITTSNDRSHDLK
jgi:hypothetical protein